MKTPGEAPHIRGSQMGTKAKSTHGEAPGQNEGHGQETSNKAARRSSESREEDMPGEGWSKKRTEALCDRLLCKALEGSSRTEGRSLRAVGRRSDMRRQWQTSGAHFQATNDPGGGQKKGNPEAADQVLGLRTTWEPPLSDMCADTQGSEALLQQGAPQPPEGHLHTVHTETHTTARAVGQPAHPGSGGQTSAQATHGEDSPRGPACTPRASPPTNPQQRGEGNEATKGDPPPSETRQVPTLGTPGALARPHRHGGDINTPPKEALA